MEDNLKVLRRGLLRTESDPLFGLAWQGTAAETARLRSAGLINNGRIAVVDGPRGPMGYELTNEGERIARRMRS